MRPPGLRCLRPYLWRASESRKARVSSIDNFRQYARQSSRIDEDSSELSSSTDVQHRIEELRRYSRPSYPRISSSSKTLTCHEFRKRYKDLQQNEKCENETLTIRGRIRSLRIAGSKLVFLDLVQDGEVVQGVCNLGRLESYGITKEDFEGFSHISRQGDIYSITGIPYRTGRGELSILAAQLPTLLAPNLHKLPTKFTNKEAIAKLPHVNHLVNLESIDALRLRSHIIQYVRSFFTSLDFLEVETPILTGRADGAIASSFKTNAKEFAHRELSLRIAPEIWLKRLILGGMDRIFEIGSSFRNEGIDATHNPEFTTCEFYKSYANLEDVIGITEDLLSGLARHMDSLTASCSRESSLSVSAQYIDSIKQTFSTPFSRIQFIPAIEAVLQEQLPDLSKPQALEEIRQKFKSLDLPVPEKASLPHLLDVLFSRLVEPSLEKPTFVTHHPACMSPLAKSFIDPMSKQEVSARTELFVGGRELVNAYEEENSPSEQRKKFLQQAAYAGKDEDPQRGINESYLEALEWGLPPTAGWGCGIDRLCMVFLSSQRIEHVRAFGNLRHVIGLSRDEN